MPALQMLPRQPRITSTSTDTTSTEHGGAIGSSSASRQFFEKTSMSLRVLTGLAGSLILRRLIGYETDELHPETVANVARPPHRSHQQISDRPLGPGPTASDR